jgi:uracil-DNA glycosylase
LAFVTMSQRKELATLLERIRGCRVCAPSLPHEPRPVLRASPTARLCLAGQAPGTRVHASGIPYSDPSGVRLRVWLGLTPEQFYDERKIAIVPMGFCFPGQDAKGGDLPPRPECAPLWRDALFALLPRLRLTLLIGRYAQLWHLRGKSRPSLTETVAAWRDYPETIMPLPHPSWRNNAWLKQNPWFETELLPVLKTRVKQALGGHS